MARLNLDPETLKTLEIQNTERGVEGQYVSARREHTTKQNVTPTRNEIKTMLKASNFRATQQGVNSQPSRPDFDLPSGVTSHRQIIIQFLIGQHSKA